MIVIIGESASGKSTLQNMFVEVNPQYKKVVTYTTRPMRENEEDGVDYHFVSPNKFFDMIAQGKFIEYTTYRDWYYGTAKADCEGDNLIAVLTPSGMRMLKRLGIDITTIYLCVDRRSRLIKILQRGDEIDEAYRRNLSDYGQFNGVRNEVDYVIDNPKYILSQDEVLGQLSFVINSVEQRRKYGV